MTPIHAFSHHISLGVEGSYLLSVCFMLDRVSVSIDKWVERISFTW